MNKREVVKAAMRHEEVPYVPWQIGLTLEARELLARHYGTEDVDAALDNHFLMLGNGYGYFEPAGGECVRDYFGVLWDRSEDKDIGVVRGQLLPEPDLRNYTFPDPLDARFFAESGNGQFRNMIIEVQCGQRQFHRGKTPCIIRFFSLYYYTISAAG